MFGRPEFRRPVSPGRVQGHDPPIGPQSQVVPDPLGLLAFRRGDVQFQLWRLLRATDRSGQGQVAFDHGHRTELAAFAGRGDRPGQEQRSPIPRVADALPRSAQPGQCRGVQGVGQQQGHIEPLPPHAADRGPSGRVPSGADLGSKEKLLIEPIAAVEQFGQLRAQNTHNPR